VIDAAKRAGHRNPGVLLLRRLTLQAACRMCLVEVEKMPKLHDGLHAAGGRRHGGAHRHAAGGQARKYMLEFLLTNHPLDCPVCDKGGECELQDMVFRYGAGESRFTEETKVHVPEKQWSPVVFSTRRAAFCASAACASATKAWA
jgi:NADH-quinone oxidoreductase subunit G